MSCSLRIISPISLRDSRFPPVGEDELNSLKVEVSVLSTPKLLAHSDGDDLIAKLRPHIDGVVIARGFSQATFLPQVWQDLPTPQEFLTRLCSKAGLAEDCWKDPETRVETYQVDGFSTQMRSTTDG